jgi:hypothetical protein
MAGVGEALLLATIVALVRRRRYRYCYAFAAYVGVQLTVNTAGLFVSAVSASWDVWRYKELLYALLRLGIAAEIAFLIFRALPRARARAVTLLLIAAAVLLVALLRDYDVTNSYTLARDLTSRFSYVTIWTLISILGLVVWYRVPLHRLHKALLHGMLWLLVAHFAAVSAAGRFGSDVVGSLYNACELVIVMAWFVVAWRPELAIDADEMAVIRYLQPWRVP